MISSSYKESTPMTPNNSPQVTPRKTKFLYDTQRDLINMSPDDILKIDIKQLNPDIEERFGNVVLPPEKEDAMKKLLARKFSTRYDFDGSVMSAGKRKRKTRKRKSRKNKK